MTFQEKIKDLLNKIANADKANALPSGCLFLNADEIVAEKPTFGDARHPYAADGMTLWAFSSGNMKIEESRFNYVLPFTEGKEPNLCFYVGKKDGDGYFPISLTGVGKLPFEKGVSRRSVFTPDAAYYLTETDEILACVRATMGKDKNARFSVYVENKGDKPLQTYLSAYFNCILSHSEFENIETKWYRKSKVIDNGFELGVTEPINRLICLLHSAKILRVAGDKKVISTTSHADYCGGMHNQLCCSTSLQAGAFEKCVPYTEFTDSAVAGDIIPLLLQAGESYEVSYSLANEKYAALKTTAEIDEELYAPKAENAVFQNIPNVAFEGVWNGLSGEKLNYFLKNVFRQAEFCARAKNYAGPFIGIRDIFQQLEAALIWIPSYCRQKIVEALNFIGNDGRAPRQYSYPPNENTPPKMDLRPFIDQGVWIISTVYTYLAQTGDFSILDEECGYYHFEGDSVELCKDRDSVLDHLLRIANYLISNLDKKTGCLHALYGDWNDALDGLGKTDEKGKEYGSGVSVMATLQLYRNLGELGQILNRVGREKDAKRYEKIAQTVRKGLQKYAIVQNEKGERKILHGWGDKRSHLVASYCDIDGENRDGLTSNAFWIICRAIDWDSSLKEDILAAYKRLDSKYGIKTFEPYFSTDNTKVGRIVRLPKGTAENGAVYIHATLFAIWSLFEMGESERAWEQLYKILPPTHEKISTTPFVMPNSYVYDEEKGMDGESMSDWFTGSGCVLLKVLLWYVFGVRADLDGVCISPSAHLPFASAEITLQVRGAEIVLRHERQGKTRRFVVNGQERAATYNEKTQAAEIRLDTELQQGAKIQITVYD